MGGRDADILGYTVVDPLGRTIGGVSHFWLDSLSGQPVFASVRTGLVRAGERVVPLRHARLDAERRFLHVPYSAALVRDAPVVPHDRVISAEEEARVLAHYRRAPEDARVGEATEEIVLHEERARVEKRLVQAGGVRLRKVTRTRIVNVPVEVRYEEIVVERVGPDEMPRGEAPGIPLEPFREGETFIPMLQEEPVVTRTTEVAGGVRAQKSVEAREETVRADVRREDVEVERLDGEADRHGRVG